VSKQCVIQFFWRSTAVLFEMIYMVILIVSILLGPFYKSIIGSMFE